MQNTEASSAVQPDFIITAQAMADIPAREALLDRAMGAGRKKKSSEKLRRGRRPAEGWLSLRAMPAA